MTKMKFAMAMLAMGGGVGAAMQAQAATVYTDTLDIPIDQALTSITVVGSAPQFEFGVDMYGDTWFGTYASFNGGTPNYALGIKTSTPGLPAAGETFTGSSYLTGKDGLDLGPNAPETPSYIHLTFNDGSTNYVGTAFVDASGELETITYTAAVPEPDAWALLIAGAALTGAAIRTARRRQSSAIA